MSNTKRNLNDKKKHLLLLIGLTFLESKLNAAECMSAKYFFFAEILFIKDKAAVDQ